MFQTTRYELVELQVPAGFTGRRLNFPDLPNLRNDVTKQVFTQAIESFCVTDIAVSPQGLPVVSIADHKAALLVLYIDGEENVYQIPVARLRITQTTTVDLSIFVRQLKTFSNLPVEWAKSYLFFTAAVTPSTSYLFGVHYIKGARTSEV